MKLVAFIIQSNIYISLAAVLLTVGAQIQLGLQPQVHPYLFIIFFATLFEYNLHRLITVLTNKDALNSEKHCWVRQNLNLFYGLVFVSVAGFAVVVFLAKKEVLLTFAPIALVTVLYSVPLNTNPKSLWRLREIPYLKIFVIAAVWSASTILLPMVQSSRSFSTGHIVWLLAERFVFLLAITIPFDIRDQEADTQSGLKTLPIVLGERKTLQLSYLLLAVYFLISLIHYPSHDQHYLVIAAALSAGSTFLFLSLRFFRKLPFYHYGILDGTMLLQGLLMWIFHCISGS